MQLLLNCHQPVNCDVYVLDDSFIQGDVFMSKLNNRFGTQIVSKNTPAKNGFYSQSPGNCAGCSNSSSHTGPSV